MTNDALEAARTGILTALNKHHDFILAVVLLDGESVAEPRSIPPPFVREPDFAVTSINYDLGELLGLLHSPA